MNGRPKVWDPQTGHRTGEHLRAADQTEVDPNEADRNEAVPTGGHF
jgi:hypothetical protein